MKRKAIASRVLAARAALATAGWLSLDQETRGPLATLPIHRGLLFRSEPQRDGHIRSMDDRVSDSSWR